LISEEEIKVLLEKYELKKLQSYKKAIEVQQENEKGFWSRVFSFFFEK